MFSVAETHNQAIGVSPISSWVGKVFFLQASINSLKLCGGPVKYQNNHAS